MQISMSRALLYQLELAFAATSRLLEANVVLMKLRFLNFKAIYEVMVMHRTCFYQGTSIWANLNHVSCEGGNSGIKYHQRGKSQACA